jgi:serine/threonine-protein kinase
MPELVFAEKYEVQVQIAQGGMGIVYKALDRKLNRVVALKVVHAHLCGDSSFLQRFLREARAMARLQHENIISIFSVEQDHGTQFIVMEYFEGTNLRDKTQPNVIFPLQEAIAITYQIAKALAYAHGHGLIHRDVKPANVLLDSDNRVKLTDFGIAAALDDAPLTSAGQLIGSLPYMSPEQARDTTLDGRSDLYSLGLIMYEMLTGTHPRRNLSNAAILGMLTAEEKIPPLTFPPSVPVEVQAVVKDLLRFRPADRIGDASQLLRRLESLQALEGAVQSSSNKPISVASDETMFEFDKPAVPTGKKPASRPEGTRHILVVLAVLGVVAGGGAGVYTLFSSPRPVPPLQPGPVDTAPPKPASDPIVVAPKPAPTAPISPPLEAAPAVTSDQRAVDRLEQLRRLVAEKNLAALDEISVMSEDRRRILEALFANYSTIEASLGEVTSTPTEVTTVLRIEKLTLLNGESVPPGATLRKIRVTIPREGDGWGKIVW